MTPTSSSITTQDVARLAQVSVGTVSRVLSNRSNVDEKLRERVLRVVDELGYIHVPRKRRNHDNQETEEETKQAGEHSEQAIKTLMFCVPIRKTPALQEAYFYQVLHGIENECARLKISVIYTVLDDSPQSTASVKEAFEAGRTDALIMVNYVSRTLIEELKALAIPLVLIDPQQPTGLEVDVVISDYYAAALNAMQYLLALGHREIALINGPERYSSRLRLQAYHIALAEAGLSYRPELIVSQEQTPEGGEAAMRELLKRQLSFGAILCANDNMGLGAARVLVSVGKRVPEEISLIGFDDHGTATLATPALTTMHASTSDKGRLAVRRLLERFAQRDMPYSWSVIPAYLVERTSTGPARASLESQG
jgi:LacI family transcriptional regulator